MQDVRGIARAERRSNLEGQAMRAVPASTRTVCFSCEEGQDTDG
jgi:hypothetical protein